MRRLIVAIAACALPVAGAIAQTCSQWRAPSTVSPTTYSGAATWYDTPDQAGAEVVAWCQANLGSSGFCNQSCGNGFYADTFSFALTAGTFPAYTLNLTKTCSTNGYTSTVNNALRTQNDPKGCPSCPPVGTSRSMIMESGPASIGDNSCGSDGCEYLVASPARNILLAGGYGTVQAGTSTGVACQASDTGARPDEAVESNDCVDSPDVIACLDPGPGCGYFNGDYVCTQHVPDDSCVAFVSGGVACVAGSPDAPLDAMSDPVEPDGTVSRGDKEVDYYAPESVGAATTPPTTTAGIGGSAIGAPGADGSAGGVASAGEGGGDTIIECVGEDCVTLDIMGECPEGETCDGTLPGDTPGEFGAVCTFAECAGDFYDRVLGSPLLSSVIGAGAAWPSGSCPSWTIEALDNEYSLSAPMCSIWDDISGFLSGVFIIVWAWVATRIFLSA